MPKLLNQGYRKDLNLTEHTSDFDVWENLYDAGLANDLAIITNNLRNTSVVGFSSINNEYFEFGNDGEFTYTNNDRIQVNETVQFGTGAGSTSLTRGIDYYVCDSDTRSRFKLSLRPSTSILGISTITIQNDPVEVGGKSLSSFTWGSILGWSQDGGYDPNRTDGTYSGVSATGGSGSGATFNVVQNPSYQITISNIGSGYKSGEVLTIPDSVLGGGGGEEVKVTLTDVQDLNLVRQDPVNQDNIVNFMEPIVQDDEEFAWLNGQEPNHIFTLTNVSNEIAEYFLDKKYAGNKDMITDRTIKFEGSIVVADPDDRNATGAGVTDIATSPGVFIGETRAFSTDNNPWNPVGASGLGTSVVQTQSTEISIGELFFDSNIKITGITTEQVTTTPENVGNLTSGLPYKLPVVINDETYYILMDRP